MHIGIYIHNGIAPSLSQVELKFKSAADNLANEFDFIHNIFGANTALRHKEMKDFFACCNPAVPIPPRKQQPNFKVSALFR